ncbi:hypothetical protein Mgra_00009902, partial [Meloidogyne graminicola]
ACYLIVNQPNFGIIECLRNNFNEKNNKKWSICSSFTQNEINSLKVRYTNKRSTNMLLPPKSDDFDFQVFCSSTASLIQNFQIDFITLSIRVFIQETLKLNQTDQGLISRQNILATVFPQHFTTDQLYFNIIEAPKLGMLLRLVIETGRHRRVGISSNITQKQIDEGLFFYKLHFASFSVLNDFFTFRLLTPAGASEEIFRFDIVYLPGGRIGEIKLKNNTLIIEEGKIQEITNNTLWLESSDGNNNYLFRVILPPMNGILFLLNKNENKKNILDFDDIFNSNDILENKLYYKHYGDLSKWDRIYLIAESKIRDPGGVFKNYSSIIILSIMLLLCSEETLNINLNERYPSAFFYLRNKENNIKIFKVTAQHPDLVDIDIVYGKLVKDQVIEITVKPKKDKNLLTSYESNIFIYSKIITNTELSVKDHWIALKSVSDKATKEPDKRLPIVFRLKGSISFPNIVEFVFFVLYYIISRDYWDQKLSTKLI